MGALADGAGLVVGGDGKGELAAVHGGDLRLGPYLHPYGGGGVVAHVQPGAHGALPLLQGGLGGVDGGVLHQGDHLGSSEHGQQAAAHGGGGVLIVDHARGAALASYSNGHELVSPFQLLLEQAHFTTAAPF